MTSQLRWWDGSGWTEHLVPAQPVPVPVMAGPQVHVQGAYAVQPRQPAPAYQPSFAGPEFAGPPCQACGAGPSAELKLNRLRGLLLIFVVSTWKGRWCRDCAVGPFRDAQNFTLAWGWWGFLTLFFTPIALLMNLRQLHLARRLPAPAGRRSRVLSAGEPQNQRPGLWISGALLLVIIILIITRG
jgi:hypothetical protein